MENKDLLRFAENVRKQRTLNCYTEEEIAEKLGIAKEEYIDFETGKKYPGSAVISQLSALFNCPLNDLYDKEIIPFAAKARGTINDIVYGVRIGDCRADYELIDFWSIYRRKEIGNVLREFFSEERETENRTFAGLIQRLAMNAERFYGKIKTADSDDCKALRIQAGYSFCSGMVCFLEMIVEKKIKMFKVLQKIQSGLGTANEKETCGVLIMDWFVPFIKTVEAAFIWSDRSDSEKLCLTGEGFSKAILYEFYNQHGEGI